MNPASNYATGRSYEDDGRGQIQCPKKGLMAIQRCRQLQRETADAGASCRCSVYASYIGGEPDREVEPIAPGEKLCGREVTKKLDVEIGRLTKLHRRPITPARTNEQEVNVMATHKKDGRLCDKCGKPSPDNTRVKHGLCSPCRALKRDAEIAAKKKSAGKELEKIIVKHTQAAEAKPPAPVTTTTPAPATPSARQQVLPAVAEQEIASLKRLVEDRDRDLLAMKHELARVKWIAYGVRNGYEPVERLVEIEEKPRGRGGVRS